jgi:hypothetical protein
LSVQSPIHRNRWPLYRPPRRARREMRFCPMPSARRRRSREQGRGDFLFLCVPGEVVFKSLSRVTRAGESGTTKQRLRFFHRRRNYASEPVGSIRTRLCRGKIKVSLRTRD